MALALDGIVVADFTRVLAGPYATMLLGDLGATVIKVERPELGDDTRHWGPPFDSAGRATYFESVNRNKTSVAIDMRSPDGLAEAHELIKRADVVMHNFAPDHAVKFGLDYDSVRSLKDDVVYCSITGFGAGTGAALPGYDLLVQAMGGLMSVTGPSAGHPNKVGVALVDVITGLHATVGVLAALNHRTTTGEGQNVEVNLLSSLLSAMVNQSSAYVSGGVVPGILGNAHPSISPYEVYQTADRQMVLACGNDGQFVKLCGALGIPELATDSRFQANSDRVLNREALNEVLNEQFVAKGADEWATILNEVGVPTGPINSIAEAFELATSLGLNPIIDIEQDGEIRKQVAHPITFSATPARYAVAPPSLDEE